MFTLQLYPPRQVGQPLGRALAFDINPDLTACTFSTGLPGGYVALEVAIARTMRPDGQEVTLLEDPTDVQMFGEAVLWNGSVRCFEGRIMRIDRNGGGVSGFGAQGYGVTALTDDVITASSTNTVSAGILLQQTISARAPLLGLSPNFLDTGVMHSYSEFTGQLPADMVNQFISEGGNNGVLWDYYVYEDRLLQFVPRLPPSGAPGDLPDYHIPFDSNVTWSEDGTGQYGGIVVTYQPISGVVGTTGRIVNPTFVATYGLQRTNSVSGGKMRSATAKAYAKTQLAVTSVPQYQVGVTRQDSKGLTTPGGTDMPPWLVRASQWLQIGTLPIYLPIIRTQFDCSALTLQVEAGQPIPSGDNLVRDFQRTGSHLIRGTNVKTGAKT